MNYPNDFINKIICGDCLEVMKSIPNDSVDLVFTSPPYNTGGKGKCKDFYKGYSDDLTSEEYFALLHNSLQECLRICKGLIFYNLNYVKKNQVAFNKFIWENTDCLKEVIIWKKKSVQPPIGNILGKRYEFIYLFTKNDDFEINDFKQNKAEKYKQYFGNWISNLIEMETDSVEFSDIHKAGFPIKLPQLFIDIYTDKNDVVLDPFIGLGSTALASRSIERDFIGIDTSKEYCEIAEKRLRQEVLL